ncbi:ABC transporter ATP-binding protein [Phytomonospora sp. NPDC050363]|uniref:ABC transporter ATP-binding protein n=1 Tax=Phytomonospora sp. NPDC050363 TaxID=3155642 RepID=UPI003408D4B4
MFGLLENSTDPFRAHDLRTPPDRPWRFLLDAFRPLRGVVALSVFFTVVGAGVEVWLIGFAGRLVDTLADTAPKELWAVHGTELLTVAALLLIGRPLLHLLSEGLDDIAFRPNARATAIWRAHRHVSRQSVGWFRADLAGRVATWVREGGTAASDAAYSVVHTLAYVGAYIAFSVWLMASIGARMVFPLLVWIALYTAMTAYIVPRYRRASERRQRAESQLNGHLVDSYANIDTLALFADRAEGDREDRRVFATARRGHFGVQRLEVLINTGMMALNGVLMVGLVGYGIHLWTTGGAPIGLVAAGLALSFRITAMAEWLLDGVSALFGSIGVLRQALLTVAQPLAVADVPGAGPLALGGGGIRFEGVSHHYGKGEGGLDGVSLEVSAGEKVGLVGRSGAGKSTLVNLLLRFHDPEDGRIEIDGQDVAGVTQESLRRAIAMVPQEATLLHRSVRGNIAYGGGTDEGVEAAARKASAHTFITGLRDRDGRTGYDAHVGERGARLSGGQRQRVALARAIHKDAPILVLDEATSALDSEVEAAIQDTLDEVMRGRTVIAIAHRLSTIARMDRIVVLDAGRVAEEGGHAELLARGGIYASLWARQSGGFLGVDPDVEVDSDRSR